MLSILKRILGARDTPPQGVSMVDAHTRDCAELVRRCVVAQLQEAGLPLLARGASHRSLVLGYVATLAEQMGLRLKKENSNGTAILICLLAMEGIEAEPNQEALLAEFSRLSEAREHWFGQGGAIALQDFPGFVKKVPPRGLAIELMGAGAR